MNLKQKPINGNRILSRNMEYLKKKTQKTPQTKDISKHCHYFQN